MPLNIARIYLQAKMGTFGPSYGLKMAKKINICLILLHSTLSDEILSGKIFVSGEVFVTQAEIRHFRRTMFCLIR